MIDANTELIRALLGCGYADIKKMTDVMEMGEELLAVNPIERTINDHVRDEIDFNSILYDAMMYITYSLVRELDEQEDVDFKYNDVLDEHWNTPYTNYMDSYFQIDCLDGWSKGDSKDKLLSDLAKELSDMEKRSDK